MKSLEIARMTEALKASGFTLLTETRSFIQGSEASEVTTTTAAANHLMSAQGNEKDAIRINKNITPLQEQADNVLFHK